MKSLDKAHWLLATKKELSSFIYIQRHMALYPSYFSYERH
jgi:hypothetical protein